ncbi:MAG: hypothetical protein JWN25_947 [Verrucomicrobiales bacterium]|nr:hypothetical protein [Verrucomicrobiales bacterium]
MSSISQSQTESTYTSEVPTALKAGQLTAEFFRQTGWLRYIRIGDHELARAIYPTLRGTNWETISFQVRVISEEIEENAFSLQIQGESAHPDLQLKWTARISGAPNSVITYEMEWMSEEDLRVNRIGLCVLHPASECVAKACRITGMEGKEVPAQFPGSIKADPIFDRPFQKISYEVGPAVKGEIVFEGGPFETEDQRNWGDASFKSYTPPSADPKPFKVHSFASSSHKVTVQLAPPAKRVLAILHGKQAQFSIATTPVLPLPLIGFDRSASPQGNIPGEFEFFHISDARQIPAFKDWITETTSPLHLGIKISALTDEQMSDLASWVSPFSSKITLWRLEMEPTARETELQLARFQKFAEKIQSRSLLAVGTPFDFMDFNKASGNAKNSALPWFGYRPTVHAEDATTVMENIGTLEWLRKSAGNFSPGEVALGPVRLGVARSHDLPAAWLVGFFSIVLKIPGFHSICLAPEDFNTKAISKILELMAGYRKSLPTLSDHPLQALGFTLLNAKNQKRVFLANLLGVEQPVKLKSGVCKATISRLTLSSLGSSPQNGIVESQEAVGAKLEFLLKPWEVLVIDILE